MPAPPAALAPTSAATRCGAFRAACSCRRGYSGRGCGGAGDQEWQLPPRGRRRSCDAAELDRRVARVTVVGPHHPHFGGSFLVSNRHSGRGPELIVIRPPDGRERSISTSVTDLGRGSDGRPGSRGASIFVRTLLPLTARLFWRATRNSVSALTGMAGLSTSLAPAIASPIYR